MKYICIFLLLIPFAGLAQTTIKEGTIKVKKEKQDSVVLTNIEWIEGDPIYPDSDTAIYNVADVMPEFPGGNAKMMQFISNNLKYPSGGMEYTGTCYVTFVVNKDGTLSNIKILRGISGCPECDNEVLRVVKLMPQNWKPGEANGVPVRTRFNLPIRICLR